MKSSIVEPEVGGVQGNVKIRPRHDVPYSIAEQSHLEEKCTHGEADERIPSYMSGFEGGCKNLRGTPTQLCVFSDKNDHYKYREDGSIIDDEGRKYEDLIFVDEEYFSDWQECSMHIALYVLISDMICCVLGKKSNELVPIDQLADMLSNPQSTHLGCSVLANFFTAIRRLTDTIDRDESSDCSQSQENNHNKITQSEKARNLIHCWWRESSQAEEPEYLREKNVHDFCVWVMSSEDESPMVAKIK